MKLPFFGYSGEDSIIYKADKQYRRYYNSIYGEDFNSIRINTNTFIIENANY